MRVKRLVIVMVKKRLSLLRVMPVCKAPQVVMSAEEKRIAMKDRS